jgi:hypothetical protein
MDKIQRHELSKFRKRREGRIELARMASEFPRLCVYWAKKGKNKREYCDLRRTAIIVNKTIEEVFDNLRWGEGSWETDKFQIQAVSAEEWDRATKVSRTPIP